MNHRTGQDQGNGSGAEKWTAAVTAATGAATAVFGMLGAGDTATLVSRMVRNHPWLSALGFSGVELSIVLAVGAIAAHAWGDRRVARWLMPVGVVLLVLGLCVLTVPALLIHSTHEVPRVSARLKIDTIRTLEADIKATGVAADDRVAVQVDALRWDEDDHDRGHWTAVLPIHLYNAAFGPDAKGEVDVSLEVPAPPGDYSHFGIKTVVEHASRLKETETAPRRVEPCDAKSTSCTFVFVPKPTRQPQLFAALEPAGASGYLLTAKVGGQDVEHGDPCPADVRGGDPCAQGIHLRVHGRAGATAPWSELLSTVLAPNAKGVVEPESIKLPVRERITQLCVTAAVDSVNAPLSQEPLKSNRCPGPAFKGVWSLLQPPVRQVTTAR
jgi:hypothetical protein